MDYDLELDGIVEKIRQESKQASRPLKILLQLPDGLKPQAKEIKQYIESKTKDVKIFIWAGSCFGACDIPLDAQNLGIDLLIQLGHSEWN